MWTLSSSGLLRRPVQTASTLLCPEGMSAFKNVPFLKCPIVPALQFPFRFLSICSSKPGSWFRYQIARMQPPRKSIDTYPVSKHRSKWTWLVKTRWECVFVSPCFQIQFGFSFLFFFVFARFSVACRALGISQPSVWQFLQFLPIYSEFSKHKGLLWFNALMDLIISFWYKTLWKNNYWKKCHLHSFTSCCKKGTLWI